MKQIILHLARQTLSIAVISVNGFGECRADTVLCDASNELKDVRHLMFVRPKILLSRDTRTPRSGTDTVILAGPPLSLFAVGDTVLFLSPLVFM